MNDDRSIEQDLEGAGDGARPGDDLDEGVIESIPGPVRSDLWQIPTIILSLILIAAAVVVGINRAPKADFEPLIAQAESLLQNRHLDAAGEHLREIVEPNLDLATERQRGRFHLAVAHWISLTQEAEGVDRETNNRRIDEQFSKAVEHGIILDAASLEAWAHAQVSLGRVDRASDLLKQMDVLDDGSSFEVRERRGRVFRRIIMHALRQPRIQADEIMKLLVEYREDQRASLSDKIWAVARQAEVRLASGRPREAVDTLLVDLRRIEYHAEASHLLDLGEIYTLLGRGYYELGEYDQAQFVLNQALNQFEGGHPARGDALTLLGKLAMAAGEHDAAFERFDEVVRDFPDTPSYVRGILGRAEVTSVLGYHESSREDYGYLVDLMRENEDAYRDVTPRRVARSLIDRHDAAIAVGDLRLALEYISLAERAFRPSAVPSDVLFRQAATSRQLADNLLADVPSPSQSMDPEARQERLRTTAEVNRLYQQAGDYFVRHARAVAGLPTETDAWAESLWLAADSYDQGGLHELAIVHLEEFLAGRSRQDPLRADVTFRLAQANHALQRFEEAATHYEQVIREYPRSVQATQSYVPLARSYLALGRAGEAEQMLNQVLAGLQPVQPDAADYRNVLVELGRIHYRAGNYVAAIERLDEAVQRYEDDPRHTELRFKLADSYRSHALEIAARIREPSAESPGERRRLDEIRRDHLQRAQRHFDDVCEIYGRIEARRLDEIQRDTLRSAHIYRADCAFLLGNFEQAIQLYDVVARRYADHYSSLHALIQIVNAYSALGDEQRAQAAHRRALARLMQLRDDAFDTPEALLDREAWERWLENAPIGPIRSASAAG